MTAKTPSFEKAMADLEKIVAELENEQLPLEKAMKKFEQGIELSRYCHRKLDETEQRITLLMQDGEGRVSEQAFDGEPADDV